MKNQVLEFPFRLFVDRFRLNFVFKSIYISYSKIVVTPKNRVKKVK